MPRKRSGVNVTEQMPVSRKHRGSVDVATMDPDALRLALSVSNSESDMTASSPRLYLRPRDALARRTAPRDPSADAPSAAARFGGAAPRRQRRGPTAAS